MTRNSINYKNSWLNSLSIGIFTSFFLSMPIGAAERIYFNADSVIVSLSLESLETFARDGTINKELEFYLKGVDAKERAKFREALQKSYRVDPVQIARFFRTPTGESILTNIGNLIRIPGGKNGKYALRGALIQAAADPGGLNIINLLRNFPTNIEFNTNRIIAVFNSIENLIEANKFMVKELDNLSEQKALKEPFVDFSALPDISKKGEFNYLKQRLNLKDQSRNRQFYVDIYRPESWGKNKSPIIIISHGLASRPEDYDTLAKHLASHGYVVGIPQHPGSDFQQVQGMLMGYSRELFTLNEFIDRPLDISYLLDELERRNISEFDGHLDLEKVGAVGHSFGGYTVLALAGGEINFENLQKKCDQTIWSPNLSLLVQCRALDLTHKVYNLRDPRIKAIVAVNPINSGIFGAKGLSQISIPVFIVAGSQDPATPLVIEQGQAFVWLTNSDKYLGLVKGQAHLNFSKLDAGTQALIKSFADLTIPEQGLIDKYDNALTLAFLEVYVNQNEKYRTYLQASYADYISQKPFEVYLVDSSSSDALREILRRFALR